MTEKTAQKAPKSTFATELAELQSKTIHVPDGNGGTREEAGPSLSPMAATMLLAYVTQHPQVLTGSDKKEVSPAVFAMRLKQGSPWVWVNLRRCNQVGFARALKMYRMPPIEGLALQGAMSELAHSLTQSFPAPIANAATA